MTKADSINIPERHPENMPKREEKKKITKEELLAALRKLADRVEEDTSETEICHMDADALLLQYINDPEIEDAYDAFDKWYS